MRKVYIDRTACLKGLFADESLFSISNGIIGLRGSISEDVPPNTSHHPGLYHNGIYTTYPYSYEEKGHGFPDEGQVMVNLPRVDILYASINNQPINMNTATFVSCTRELDTSTGISTRSSVYEIEGKGQFVINDRRTISINHPNVIAIEYEVHSSEYSGEIELISMLDPSVKNFSSADDPRVLDYDQALFTVVDINQRHAHIRTKETFQDVHLSFKHKEIFEHKVVDNRIIATRTLSIGPNQPIQTTKYIVVTSSIQDINPHKKNRDVLGTLESQTIEDFKDNRTSSVTIRDSKNINEIVQFNIFQLERSGGLSQRYNIPAKGLSGEGYEGHYFWDTEMYMFPYFLYTNPTYAKNLLLYRYYQLDDAKQEAINLGHLRGAKYPWRTINGSEVSPYYPAGSAQYHINAIIAYQFIQYLWVTNDVSFMMDYGFEVLYQTALVYLEIGNMHNDEFVIHGVTGPDEYTAVVDNNYYTNSMVQFQLEQTVRFYHKHKKHLSSYDPAIIKEFDTAAQSMKLLFDQDLNINPQDDSFLSKKRLPKGMYKKPLLLHCHPLTIYRHQVCKQADVIASHMLLNNVDIDVMRDSVNYYEEVTTHDSSLSKCIFSIQHLYVNQLDVGDKYFQDQLLIDILDTHHNTGHGLHVANLGGTYLVLLYGFLGLRITEDEISIRPQLAPYMDQLSFVLHYRGGTVAIDVTDKQVQIDTTVSLTMTIYDITYLIHNKTTVRRSLQVGNHLS